MLLISINLHAQSCNSNTVILMLNTGDWASEVSWSITDSIGTISDSSSQVYSDYTQYIDTLCLPDGCYQFNMYDSYGDGWQGGSYELSDSLGNFISSGDLQGSYFVGSNPFSVNYNCNYPIFGCACPSAVNYNPNSTVDDSSCTFLADNLTLLSQWSDSTLPTNGLNGSYNEVYGFAVNQMEFAVIGSTMGTHIIDITNPSSPSEIAFIAGENQGSGVTHRDFHTMGNYLYAVCDQGGSTLQIIDIGNLPNSISLVYNSSSLFNTCHNIFIDTTVQKLYACDVDKLGTNSWHSPLRIYDLSNPISPVLIHDLDNLFNGVHDVWVENDTAYVNSTSAGLRVIDVTGTPIIIGSLTSYPDAGTNHSGWKFKDTYVFADENHGYDVKVVDASDVSNLTVSSLINSNVNINSIAHNVMIKDNLLFLSYYHDGLQIFDISNPYTPVKVGYYDTYLTNDHNGYAGAWGIYCYLPSGNILISDVQTGLYVLSFEHDNANICEGDSIEIYGNFESEQGYYYDSILDTLDYYNLDVTALSFYHNTVNNQSIIINPGDSIYLGGSYQSQNGTYIDSLTSTWGCDSIVITQLTIDVTNFVSDSFKNYGFSAFPNPANKQLNINSEINGIVYIYNILGKEISRFYKNDCAIAIDVTNYSAGTYIIKLNNHSLKFIVDHY